MYGTGRHEPAPDVDRHGGGAGCRPGRALLWPPEPPGSTGSATNVANPVGQIFLRLLFMLVIPLILSALVVGVAGIELRAAGTAGRADAGLRGGGVVHRRGIGLLLVNADPARRVGEAPALRAIWPAPPPRRPRRRRSGLGGRARSWPWCPTTRQGGRQRRHDRRDRLRADLRRWPSRSPGPRRPRRLRRVDAGPVRRHDDLHRRGAEDWRRSASGALLFVMGVRLGDRLCSPAGRFVAIVLLGLGLHMVVVYSLLVKVVGKTSPRRFFRDVRRGDVDRVLHRFLQRHLAHRPARGRDTSCACPRRSAASC